MYKGHELELTAWPLLSGLMSRKAKVLSLSKSFMEGISPGVVVRAVHMQREGPKRRLTLDDFAEDAGCHVD